MAWVKVPKEHHPLLIAALPKDPRVRTLPMFGSLAAMVNGNMFGGLFARSAIVKLGDDDYREAMNLDGATPFDPMGTGRVMSNTVMLPDSVMDEPAELEAWLARAFTYTAALPPKKKKAKSATKKPAAKKPVAKKPVAKKPAAKQRTATRRK